MTGVIVEWIVFIACALLAVGAALFYVLTMSMYRAGLTVMVSFVALAGLFILLEADLLAAIQVMMAIGSMLLMILFMVMEMPMPGGEMMWMEKRRMKIPWPGAMALHLRGQKPPKEDEAEAQGGGESDEGEDQKTWKQMSRRERWDLMWQMGMQTNQLPWAIALGGIAAAVVIVLVLMTPWNISSLAPTREPERAVGELLLSRYMLGMEVAAFLILGAIVGAVVLGSDRLQIKGRKEEER